MNKKEMVIHLAAAGFKANEILTLMKDAPEDKPDAQAQTMSTLLTLLQTQAAKGTEQKPPETADSILAQILDPKEV